MVSRLGHLSPHLNKEFVFVHPPYNLGQQAYITRLLEQWKIESGVTSPIDVLPGFEVGVALTEAEANQYRAIVGGIGYIANSTGQTW